MGHSVTGHAAAGQPAGVVPPMKRQVPFEWQMEVSRAAKEREHAEREAHDKTQKIELSFAATLAADARGLLAPRFLARPGSRLRPGDPPGQANGESPPAATPPC